MFTKRKQFVVEKQVQYALGLRIMLHWLAFLFVTIFVGCALQMMAKLDQVSFGQSLQAALVDQLSTVMVLLALLPWFIHDSLRLSNRFAGPMVRLRKSLTQLTSSEDVNQLSFRKGDFWQQAAVEFNALQDRVLEDRKQLAEARSLEADKPQTTRPLAIVGAPIQPSTPTSVV